MKKDIRTLLGVFIGGCSGFVIAFLVAGSNIRTAHFIWLMVGALVGGVLGTFRGDDEVPPEREKTERPRSIFLITK